MAKTDLKKLKEALSQLDDAFISLFETRQELAKAIFNAKKNLDNPESIYDPIQEEQTCIRAAKTLTDENKLTGISMMSHLMQSARIKQYVLDIEPQLEEKKQDLKNAYIRDGESYILDVEFYINVNEHFLSNYLDLFVFAGAPILYVKTEPLEEKETCEIMRVHVRIGLPESMDLLVAIMHMIQVELSESVEN